MEPLLHLAQQLGRVVDQMQLGAEAVRFLAVVVEGIALEGVDGLPGLGQGDAAFPRGGEDTIDLLGEVPVGIGGHFSSQECQGAQVGGQVRCVSADCSHAG